MRPSKTDSVLIEDLMIHTHIGCTKDERAHPQRLLLSAEVTLDLSLAASSGDLEDSVCYSKLAKHYSSLAASKAWVLLEELAQSCISETLSQFEAVSAVELSIKKFAVANTAWVGIRMYRSRNELSHREPPPLRLA